MVEVTVYTSRLCAYCTAVKTLLRDKKVVFNEVDVTFSPVDRARMAERSGRTSVPQIFIDDTHVGGCDDLHSLDDQGELDTLLAGESA